MNRITRADLLTDLEQRTFAAPAVASLTPRRVGAEVELIPVDATTGRPCPLEDGEGPATLPFLRRFGSRQGWTEQRTAKGIACFGVRGGGVLTFEPGGQIEYSSPPSRSATALINQLRAVVLPLRSAAAGDGITLLTLGIDPRNPVEQVPLQLSSDRYRRMAEHFARIGPNGARMMRQTAALQVSLDFEAEPLLRWRLLNAVAPFLTAIFANSPVYAGRNTGHRSYRAHCWRTLDPRRTGLPYDERRPVEAYLEFALGAPAILFPTVDGQCLPFGDWLGRANLSMEEWDGHLTTLFPEVRPRGHFELRCMDAIDPSSYPAALALVGGLTYEPRACLAALELLPPPDLGLLERAGRLGMGDPAIAQMASDIFEIGLAGCVVLGPKFLHPAHLEEAWAYFERYTRVGRAPANELRGCAFAA